MLKGLYTAYTGMLDEQHRMDVITNNLANVNTTGFKKEGATSESFKDTLAYKIKDLTESPNIGRRIGPMSMGVKTGENYVDYSDGPITETNNPANIALTGPGFFKIEYTNKRGETSIKYTRDGSFVVKTDGSLCTKDGDFVLSQDDSHIELDPLKDFTIGLDGKIVQLSKNGDTQEVATIGLADFEDYNYLEHFGENFYQPVEGATEKEATGVMIQGFLEHSNVQVVHEMVDMIALQRHYEANQKVITTYDGSLDIAVNQLGKL